MWSAGIIWAEMLAGGLCPFTGNSARGLLKSIVSHLGPPSDLFLDALEMPQAKTFLMSSPEMVEAAKQYGADHDEGGSPPRRRRSFGFVSEGLSVKKQSVAFLKSLLRWEPNSRAGVVQCLESDLLAGLHCEEDEPSFDAPRRFAATSGLAVGKVVSSLPERSASSSSAGASTTTTAHFVVDDLAPNRGGTWSDVGLPGDAPRPPFADADCNRLPPSSSTAESNNDLTPEWLAFTESISFDFENRDMDEFFLRLELCKEALLYHPTDAHSLADSGLLQGYDSRCLPQRGAREAYASSVCASRDASKRPTLDVVESCCLQPAGSFLSRHDFPQHDSAAKSPKSASPKSPKSASSDAKSEQRIGDLNRAASLKSMLMTLNTFSENNSSGGAVSSEGQKQQWRSRQAWVAHNFLYFLRGDELVARALRGVSCRAGLPEGVVRAGLPEMEGEYFFFHLAEGQVVDPPPRRLSSLIFAVAEERLRDAWVEQIQNSAGRDHSLARPKLLSPASPSQDSSQQLGPRTRRGSVGISTSSAHQHGPLQETNEAGRPPGGPTSSQGTEGTTIGRVLQDELLAHTTSSPPTDVGPRKASSRRGSSPAISGKHPDKSSMQRRRSSHDSSGQVYAPSNTSNGALVFLKRSSLGAERRGSVAQLADLLASQLQQLQLGGAHGGRPGRKYSVSSLMSAGFDSEVSSPASASKPSSRSQSISKSLSPTSGQEQLPSPVLAKANPPIENESTTSSSDSARPSALAEQSPDPARPSAPAEQSPDRPSSAEQSSSYRRASTMLHFRNPDQSVIIFDWDDTLFPTTWIQDDVQLDWKIKLDWQLEDGDFKNQVSEKLENFQTEVVSLLRHARSLAHVLVVTLSRSPWVETAGYGVFLPTVYSIFVPHITGGDKIRYFEEKRWRVESAVRSCGDEEGQIWGGVKYAGRGR